MHGFDIARLKSAKHLPNVVIDLIGNGKGYRRHRRSVVGLLLVFLCPGSSGGGKYYEDSGKGTQSAPKVPWGNHPRFPLRHFSSVSLFSLSTWRLGEYHEGKTKRGETLEHVLNRKRRCIGKLRGEFENCCTPGKI